VRRLTTRALPIAIALALGLAAQTSWAAPAPRQKFGRKASGWGLGLSLGDVTGGSVKYFVHPHHAFQGQIGWGLLHNGDGIASFEYLWHSGVIGESDIVDVLGYVGLGVGVGDWAGEGVTALEMHVGDPGGGAAMMLRAPVLGLAFH